MVGGGTQHLIPHVSTATGDGIRRLWQPSKPNSDHKANIRGMLATRAMLETTMQFGGRWTETKLEILEAYLNAYTTALKRTPFRLIYIDAFAGTGRIELQEDGETIGFLRGSTERALRVCDKPFDELMFIERHPARCAELEKLRLAHPKRRIAIEQGEVNSVLGLRDPLISHMD